MLQLRDPMCLSCVSIPIVRLFYPLSRSTRLTYRSMSQLQKRRPGRMTLSPKVDQKPPKLTSSGKPVRRRTENPLRGMNQRDARVYGVPKQRSAAELKRSTAKGSPQQKEESRGGFKALKMQRALSAVSYSHRNTVKKMISEIDSFEQFPLIT